MFSHSQIWQALDKLAEVNGLSASGLARAAGLDATSFNKSKRATPNGKPRWPSTESVAKCLDATRTSLEDFAGLLHGMQPSRRRVPRIDLDRAGEDGLFDSAGYPSGNGWDEINLLQVSDKHAYALKITGNAMIPAYRDGDTIIVSPGSSLKPRDRVLVKSTSGECLIRVLQRETETTIEFTAVTPQHTMHSMDRGDIKWMARIVWTTQ